LSTSPPCCTGSHLVPRLSPLQSAVRVRVRREGLCEEGGAGQGQGAAAQAGARVCFEVGGSRFWVFAALIAVRCPALAAQLALSR
jgi:hypothetical protein